MGRHTYGESGYGMFLDEEESYRFCDAYAEVQQNPAVQAYLVPKTLGLRDFLGDDVYDICEIHHLDGKDHPEDKDRFREGLFFFAERQGSVFRADGDKACYADIREMAEEFRQKYAAYLPDGFDFETHLVRYVGVMNP
ncbi:MAG: hypothetical protein LKG48_04965 [Lachnospiraceae bacterium]|jgi:hypothetical protein|nr:hypothetical protein [Lachnospiraceae bacterium]MCH4062935.1 hypothetical protein [Lachnospiraceae bacterium]MCH4104241.1 hypothetical protein [Lachnospiraceae bacterium]MCI1309098.1 hypothetical protein [Lachnospiraceae bacterium]MCI1356990.1 hypothetical protein [Lachnospiraceae bacterium]